MTPAKFRAVRKKLGYEHLAWGRALGYESEVATVQRLMRRFEAGDRRISLQLERLVLMYEKHGVPKGWL
jgi:hypothetical protein